MFPKMPKRVSLYSTYRKRIGPIYGNALYAPSPRCTVSPKAFSGFRAFDLISDVKLQLEQQQFQIATIWNIASLREAKPGGFQTRGVSHFFRERSRLCRGPFRDCSS